MRALVMMCCLLGVTLAVPVVKRASQSSPEFPSFIQVEASNPVEAVRKARQLIDIDIDVYNNNGAGYFDNGDDFYGGGYGGYGGYGGGYGGYGGGYGYGGYGGYGYPGYFF